MRVLIISDFRGWAFGHISKSIQKFNQDTSVDIDIIYLHDCGIKIAQSSWGEYDVILLMGWYLYEHFRFIPKNKIIVGIHSFCKWDYGWSKGKRVAPPTQAFVDYLQGFSRINLISQRLFNLFSQYDLPDIYYTPNGVDCDLFRPEKDMPDKFTIGVIAKSYRWRLKKINQIFLPAAKKSKVEYKILLGGDDILPYKDMPDFYNSINCYVCTSKSEGFSMSALEAGACGRPLISTSVSGTEELIIPGKTGFITDMSIHSVSEKIDILKNDIEKCKYMGDTMRKHIVNNYAWGKVVPYWISFFKGDK